MCQPKRFIFLAGYLTSMDLTGRPLDKGTSAGLNSSSMKFRFTLRGDILVRGFWATATFLVKLCPFILKVREWTPFSLARSRQFISCCSSILKGGVSMARDGGNSTLRSKSRMFWPSCSFTLSIATSPGLKD